LGRCQAGPDRASEKIARGRVRVTLKRNYERALRGLGPRWGSLCHHS
jgi:hypothetical protein